jgi:hypothetical protein
MKISIILTIFMFLGLQHGNAEYEPDEIDLKILKGIEEPSSEKYDVSWITEDFKPVVIERLLRMAKDKHLRHYAEPKLVTMGHIETIQRQVEEFQKSAFQGEALSGLTEEGIPYIAPLVYTGSKEISKAGDLYTSSIRTSAVGYLLGAIRHSEKMPFETREWATQIRNQIRDVSGEEEVKEQMKLVTDPKARKRLESELLEVISDRDRSEKSVDLIKQWWENNQTAILEKRYADATWLPRYKGRPATYSPEEVAERKADEERERTSREASRTGGSDSKKAVDALTPTSNWPLWAALIASFFTLLGIGYYFKIRKRQS